MDYSISPSPRWTPHELPLPPLWSSDAERKASWSGERSPPLLSLPNRSVFSLWTTTSTKPSLLLSVKGLCAFPVQRQVNYVVCCLKGSTTDPLGITWSYIITMTWRQRI